MLIYVSQILTIPISLIIPFQKILQEDNIQFTQFREFKSNKNYNFTQFQKEIEHSRNYNLKLFSHIPHSAKIKNFAFRETYLQIRETGILTLLAQYSKKENENPVLVIKRMKKAFQDHLLRNIVSELISQIKEYDENIIAKNLKMRFNPPVTTIFQLLDEQESKHQSKYRKVIIDIGKSLGNANMSERRHMNDYRMVSKSFNALLSFDNNISKKGRRILREGILQSIHLAHGLSMIYDRIAIQNQFFYTEKDWRIFLNFFNPYILSENEFSRAIIGTALKQTWFKEVGKLFNLKSKIRSLLLNIVREGKLDTFEMFRFTHALRKLPYREVSPILLPTLKKPPGRISDLETAIIEKLFERHKEEIEPDIENEFYVETNLKYGLGLTIYRLTKIMGLSDNQQIRTNIRNSLNSLIEKQIIGFAPYTGRGSNLDSKSYFLNYRLIDFTDQLIKYIGEKFP